MVRIVFGVHPDRSGPHFSVIKPRLRQELFIALHVTSRLGGKFGVIKPIQCRKNPGNSGNLGKRSMGILKNLSLKLLSLSQFHIS
jgi:hypothetical protein